MKNSLWSWRYRLAALALVLASPVHAQESGLPLWEYGVIGAVAQTPAYPGASQQQGRALVLPMLVYRGEVLRVDRSGVEARLVNREDIEVDVGFSGSLPASSRDIAVRSGMDDLGTLIEFGPRARITLAHPTVGSRVVLKLPLRAALEFQGGVRQQGTTFEPELGWESRDLLPGWGVGVSGSLLYADQQLSDYFYAVPARYANASRPAYNAQAGLLATRLGLSATNRLTPDLRLFVALRHESYAGAANANSPLMQRSDGTSLAVVLAWTLGRSTQTVER